MERRSETNAERFHRRMLEPRAPRRKAQPKVKCICGHVGKYTLDPQLDTMYCDRCLPPDTKVIA